MFPAKWIWKPLLQKAVTGRMRRFRMTRYLPPWPTALPSVGLYLHVPFCRNLCPYCPYNRIEYEENLFAQYERAVKQEITLYAPYLQGTSFSSLYIGGGTPTVNWPGLIRILEHLRKTFSLDCDICVELHPGSMEDDCLGALRDAGVTMLSLGVESTCDALLARIGRSHNAQCAIAAVKRALALSFPAVNKDCLAKSSLFSRHRSRNHCSPQIDRNPGILATRVFAKNTFHFCLD